MVSVTIHFEDDLGKKRQALVAVPKGGTLMDAIHEAGQKVPHFCYHKRLSIAGNCRMCLVEVAAPDRSGKLQKLPKPIASCHYPAADGMVVYLHSAATKSAQKNTMQFLLANHPLDCPICDQGGQCDLQDMAYAYGSDVSVYNEPKRAVQDPDLGTKIKTVMTRCIHCSRCVRFATEVAGVEDIGMTGRGETTEVGTYVAKALRSPLAGNMIDLCPVGALTNKPQAFTSRPWELDRVKSLDPHDALGSHLWVTKRFDKAIHILPRENEAINEEWATDRARFSVDALTTNRLTIPLIKRGKGHSSVGWDEAMAKIIRLHEGIDPKHIAAKTDCQRSLEEAHIFCEFATDTLGTPHAVLDLGHAYILNKTNWRSATLKKPAKAFEHAKHILEIWCDMANDAPLLDLRLRRAEKAGATRESVWSAEGLSKALKGKKREDITFIASNAALQFLPESIVTAPDFHVLPAHSGTLNIAALKPQFGEAKDFSTLHKTNDCDMLWVYGDVQPNKFYREAVASGMKLIYIGTHHNPVAELADVVLPTACFTEKNWSMINAWGVLEHAETVVPSPVEAKKDWQIFRKLSELFQPNRPLPYNTYESLKAAATDAVGDGSTQYITSNKAQQYAWKVHGYYEEPRHRPPHYTATPFLAQSPTMQAMEMETRES